MNFKILFIILFLSSCSVNLDKKIAKMSPNDKYLLALDYYNGNLNKKIDQDYKEALRIFEIAAKEGNLDAVAKSAYMYQYGIGTEINFVEAIKYYNILSSVGVNWSYYELGNIYYENSNIIEAVRFWKIAANNDYYRANFKLGLLHYNGIGLAQNFHLAMDYFLKAVVSGEPAVFYNIAHMYYLGLGVSVNYQQSLKWMLVFNNSYPNQDSLNIIAKLKDELNEYSVNKAQLSANICLTSKFSGC